MKERKYHHGEFLLAFLQRSPLPALWRLQPSGRSVLDLQLAFKVLESILNRPTEPRSWACWGPRSRQDGLPGHASGPACTRMCGLRGVAQSPFTLNLHRNLILALERQRFPEKTPVESDRWDWMHCEVYAGKSKSPYDIVTPDVAGEAVMGELENPGSYKTIRALIGGWRAWWCWSMSSRSSRTAGARNSSRCSSSVTWTLKPRKRNRKIDVPVAIVFTKIDLWDEWVRDPEAFAKANAPALYIQCQTRLERFSFYFSGVAGSTSRLIDRNGQEMLVPLRVEPRGIVEPFAWMINQLR